MYRMKFRSLFEARKFWCFNVGVVCFNLLFSCLLCWKDSSLFLMKNVTKFEPRQRDAGTTGMGTTYSSIV